MSLPADSVNGCVIAIASNTGVRNPSRDAEMDNTSLGHTFLRTAWIFQAIVATPIFVFMIISAFMNYFNTVNTVYGFTTHLCTAVLAGVIIFSVLVQRKIPEPSKRLTLRFELTKSTCATGMWMWLLLDAAFGPRNQYGWYYDRQRRVWVAAISSMILL